MSLRNVGAGIGVCQGWGVRAGLTRNTVDHFPEDELRPQTRDLYIPAGDVGLWQGAIRERSDPAHDEVARAISQHEPIDGRAPLFRPGRRAAHDHPLHAGADRRDDADEASRLRQRRPALVSGPRRAALTRSRIARRLGRHLAHDLAGRPRLHQLVGLTGPQVERVRIAAPAGGGAQRARHVMDLRVGDRRGARRARP